MNPNETGNIGFSARLLEDGIHEFTWLSSSREAVDVWVEYCDSLYMRCSPDDTVYFVHVIQTANFPSMSYVVRKSRELQQKYPDQPNTRSAVLFQSLFFGGIINILKRMLNIQGKDTTQFFRLDERDKALEWLLSDED